MLTRKDRKFEDYVTQLDKFKEVKHISTNEMMQSMILSFESLLIEIKNNKLLLVSERFALLQHAWNVMNELNNKNWCSLHAAPLELRSNGIFKQIFSIASALTTSSLPSNEILAIFLNNEKKILSHLVSAEYNESLILFIQLLNHASAKEAPKSLTTLLFQHEADLCRNIVCQAKDETVAHLISLFLNLLIKDITPASELLANLKISEWMLENQYIQFSYGIGISKHSFQSQTLPAYLSLLSTCMEYGCGQLDIFNHLELMQVGENFAIRLSTPDNQKYLSFLAPLFFSLLTNNYLNAESIDKLRVRPGFQALILDCILKLERLPERKTYLEKALIPNHPIGRFFSAFGHWFYGNTVLDRIAQELKKVNSLLSKDIPNLGFRSSQFQPRSPIALAPALQFDVDDMTALPPSQVFRRLR